MAATSSSSTSSAPGAKPPSFWQRLTEGLEISQLWAQFTAEARSGYSLYSADVDWAAVKQHKGIKRLLAIIRGFAWALLMKLSPARRVMLVLALVLIVVKLDYQAASSTFSFNSSAFGVFLLLLLLALELADRVTMKRDLEIARDIQKWLVPEAPPAVAGLDIAFATRPANTVAGDYYDAFFLDAEKRRLLLVVADVAGKSVPAALLMATFQASLHSSAGSYRDLGELVTRLNRFACLRSLGGMRFTTAFLAELNVESRGMQYVNAGHNAPILRSANGTVKRLEEGGVPFGIDPEARFETGTTRVESGDLLLIFTDGLLEAVNAAGEEFGEPRILAALQAVSSANSATGLKSLLSKVDEFVGATRQHDDITCLVMRAS